MTHDEFMKIVRETNEKNNHPEHWTEAERLCHEIMEQKKSKEDYFKLKEKVKLFLKSDASEDDKRMVMGYAESLVMVCSSLEE